MKTKQIASPFLIAALAGCGGETTPAVYVDSGVDDAGTDTTDTPAEVVEQELLVPEFGDEGTRSIRGYAAGPAGLDNPLDLEFNPESPADLWVSSRGNDGIVVLFDAGTPEQTDELFLDAYRNHFLEEASGIAFGGNGAWASCHESRNTYDGQGQPNDFMGPALWPSNLDVFAQVYQDSASRQLGSHLDMLHQSPNCMGIGHYQNNEYFVFDGMNGHLVYYDFAEDHGPGEEDHADGVVRRFPEVSLTRVPGVPGHIEYHEASNRIFVADTGGQRVVAYTAGTGTKARDLVSTSERLAEFSEYSGAEVEVFVDEGLEQPSGLAINDGRLFVGDHASGVIHAYSLETGEELGTLETGAGRLAGIEISPSGTLWFIDAEFSEVLEVKP